LLGGIAEYNYIIFLGENQRNFLIKNGVFFFGLEDVLSKTALFYTGRTA